jgi:hypothetical protein
MTTEQLMWTTKKLAERMEELAEKHLIVSSTPYADAWIAPAFIDDAELILFEAFQTELAR